MKSTKVKDPKKYAETGNINDLPADAIKKYVTPYVLERDKEACKHIVERL